MGVVLMDRCRLKKSPKASPVAMPFPEPFGKTCNPDFTALSELNFHSVNPVPTDVTFK